MTITIDPTRFRLPPFKHQLVGVKALCTHAVFALLDSMGVGKTKQVIDSAGVLFDNGEIDTNVVVCPAQVKTVWLDPDLGEIEKHSWVPSTVHHYHQQKQKLPWVSGRLNWVVVSYEFLRQDAPLDLLIRQLAKRRTLLVMDESIFLKNPKARQTKQTYELSKACQRRVILNGTPIANNLLDVYAQFKCLDPLILECSTYYHFRSRYAIMGGFQNKQVVGFKNAEEINRLTAPYVLRRLKEDCLDLPPKTYTFATVPLTSETWKLYKSMRDDMAVWLDSEACLVQHAPVKALRLSQITSGFLGGIADVAPQEWELLGFDGKNPVVGAGGETRTQEIGKEKLGFIIEWLSDRYAEDKNFRVLIWCRFRAEMARLYGAISDEFNHQLILHRIEGGQKKSDRLEAVQEGMSGKGAAVILGQPHAGGFGLNLTTLPNVVYLSSDYSLLARQQSEDRVHRPGQTKNVLYTDVLACGPENQKTIDHAVVTALRKKENLAAWTTEKWREAIIAE